MKKWKTVWKVKPIKINFNLDTDRDGVPDFKDCEPFNYWKQDKYPYGYKKEEREAIKEWEREEEKHIKLKPNLTGNQVIKMVRTEKSIPNPYSPDRLKKLIKGNWGYMVHENGEVDAIYLPSMKKELAIMFVWENNQWELMTHMKGTW